MTPRPVLRVAAALSVAVTVAITAACGTDEDRTVERSGSQSTTSTPPTTTAEASTTTVAPTTTLPVSARPPWLGTRELPVGPDGLGEIQPTPDVLVDRRFATIDRLPAPPGDEFEAAFGPVPADVIERSTWTEACPVGVDELRYGTVTFWGFDGLAHTGELIVHRDVVDAVTQGFAHLHARRFPIEEMRITRADELDAPPTGDGSNTGAFTCRPAVGSDSWSEHAYGRAVDINPFHNPYVRGEVVIPELASAYVDREARRAGMLDRDAVAGFEAAGWAWGGDWRSSKDWMHLSATGR